MTTKNLPARMFDLIIRGGTVYNGTGSDPVTADIGVKGDRIITVGDLKGMPCSQQINADGLAVAPGFINMLSWSTESLILDGRSQSEVRQGVTTQIFGEGESMGPLSEEMKQRAQKGVKFEIKWNTLAEYLSHLEKLGVSQNIASFIGASTIREYVIGLENKPATAGQVERMKEIVRSEMAAGALGIGSALIYAPGCYASTDELVELCKAAAEYRGKYTSHLRSEGNCLIEGVEELINISRRARIPAEIYHLKAVGKYNWHKIDHVIKMIQDAQSQKLKITADMYVYTAGATGLDASIPPWALDGGYDALFTRMEDARTRQLIGEEIRKESTEWENLYQAAGTPDRILLIEFRSDELKHLTGKTLAEISTMRNQDPVETIMDLMLADRSRVRAVYFMISEDNIRKQLRLPWVSLCSDSPSVSAEGDFLHSSTHPRAYGNFARFLGKFVRDEEVISLQEAIWRLSGLPATNLDLQGRGFIKEGMYADIVVFDPTAIRDNATYDNPHQYATGILHVFVNGVQVLKDGEHTGAKSGRALWGIGRTK
ncbi:MAG: D-aminoacylase [Gammaproteobacteria bacterium]|nr:D-aminoacylase [Gammaproteobacteria bacterium]